MLEKEYRLDVPSKLRMDREHVSPLISWRPAGCADCCVYADSQCGHSEQNVVGWAVSSDIVCFFGCDESRRVYGGMIGEMRAAVYM